MTYLIEVLCCDCGKHLGWKEGGQKPNLKSHGYCGECLKKAMAEIDNYQAYIEGADTF